jgi:hypothetical protein
MTAPRGEGTRHRTTAATAWRLVTYDWSAGTQCVEAEQANHRVDYVTRPVHSVPRLVVSPREYAHALARAGANAGLHGRRRVAERHEGARRSDLGVHRAAPQHVGGGTTPSGLLRRYTQVEQVRPAEHVDQRLASLS